MTDPRALRNSLPTRKTHPAPGLIYAFPLPWHRTLVPASHSPPPHPPPPQPLEQIRLEPAPSTPPPPHTTTTPTHSYSILALLQPLHRCPFPILPPFPPYPPFARSPHFRFFAFALFGNTQTPHTFTHLLPLTPYLLPPLLSPTPLPPYLPLSPHTSRDPSSPSLPTPNPSSPSILVLLCTCASRLLHRHSTAKHPQPDAVSFTLPSPSKY